MSDGCLFNVHEWRIDRYSEIGPAGVLRFVDIYTCLRCGVMHK